MKRMFKGKPNARKASLYSTSIEKALNSIAEGQGTVNIGIFDPGAGGEARYSIYICLERDGLIFDKTNLDKFHFLWMLKRLIMGDIE